jgi:hypothetical protein
MLGHGRLLKSTLLGLSSSKKPNRRWYIKALRNFDIFPKVYRLTRILAETSTLQYEPALRPDASNGRLRGVRAGSRHAVILT